MSETPEETHVFNGTNLAGLRALLASGARGELAARLAELHPSDVADLLTDFDPEEQAALFRLLEGEHAANVLAEMDPETREDVIDALPAEAFHEILDKLDPDDAADIIGELEPKEALEALARIEDRRDIEALLAWPPETAGGVMTTEFVAVPAEVTVREALQKARTSPKDANRDTVYVLDAGGAPVGRLGLAKLVFSQPDVPVRRIMDEDVHAVAADLDREQVAEIVRRYDLLTVPVLDPAGLRMLGIITVDDVMDVAADEAAEDMYRLAGTGARDPLHQPIWKRAMLRLPWLLVTLVPGFLVGSIMRWLGYDPGGAGSLLLFVPVMIAMAGNVSIQSSTIMVRGLATGDVRAHRAGAILVREIGVAALVGLGCAVIAGFVGYAFFGSSAYGVVVAGSMFVGILSAAVTGTIVPMVVHAIGVDPALASGPFVMSLNDICGTLIFLGLGAQLLALLGP